MPLLFTCESGRFADGQGVKLSAHSDPPGYGHEQCLLYNLHCVSKKHAHFETV